MSNIFVAGSIPLGFNPVSILIHLFNFAILLVGVRLLFYKPIKKFMDKRKAEYIEEDRISTEKSKKAEELKEKYTALIDGVKEESLSISEKAAKEAAQRSNAIIKDAAEEAKKILESAKEKAKDEELKAKEELSESITQVAVDMASKILEREVSVKDNDAIIDSVLSKWKEKE